MLEPTGDERIAVAKLGNRLWQESAISPNLTFKHE